MIRRLLSAVLASLFPPTLIDVTPFLLFRALADASGMKELRERLVTLNDTALGIQAKADSEKRPLTDEEREQIDAIFAEFDLTEAEIERRERIEANAERAAAAQPRQVPSVTPRAAANSGEERPKAPAVIKSVQDRERHGFNNFGEFAQKVKSASDKSVSQIDQRLAVHMAVPSSYGSEGVGADGGFAVPPEFREEIMEKVMDESQLISLTDQLTASRNTISIPSDETTPWQTVGGVQAYWENEAALLTQSKPALNNTAIRLNKLTALVGATDELLEDAPALDTYLRRKAPSKINFKVSRAIVSGTGAGQPLGILNSPAKVTTAKLGAQAADTILFDNIVDMWSRMYSECHPNAIWLANQNTMPQLLKLQYRTTDVAGAQVYGGGPVFLPPGGLSSSPYGTLMGRPIRFTEACETLGDEGDLILVDLSKYMTATKVGGIRAETSMHLWFDYDMMAFRFILRVAGQPWWAAAITPRAGSMTLSCIVTLEAR